MPIRVFTFSQRQVAYVQILAESLGAVLQLRSYAAQLSASELQYRSLFDAHPQPMWVYERGSLRILAVNRAWCATTGTRKRSCCA